MGYVSEKAMDKDTTLYSIIGSSAVENSLEEPFNSIFKEMDINAKVIPLNIREDDIGFFLNGFKSSKIEAAYFEKEYWYILSKLLEDKTLEAKTCGMVDIVSVVDGKLMASVVYGRAVVELLKSRVDLSKSTISIANQNPSSMSILYNLEKELTGSIVLKKQEADIVIDDTITIGSDVVKYSDIVEMIAKIKVKEWSSE
jgi:hypothetical protein